MTDSLTRRLRLTALAAFLCLLPLPALASSVDISRFRAEGDRVTLKVEVLDDKRKPIQDLNPDDFKVETEDNLKINTTLGVPDVEVILPKKPHLIILLDMSKSMIREDSAGVKKLQGAVDAIRELIAQVRADNLPVQISLVPFGYGCKFSYEVNEKTIKNNFYYARNSSLEKQLDKLSNVPLCAATNIYQPLAEAVSYLGKVRQSSQVLSDSVTQDESPPRLAVILLSDGYHNYQRNTEQQQFTELESVLKQNPQVTVHTLGYGTPLSEVIKDFNCSVPQPITVNKVIELCQQQLPKSKFEELTEFIVDEERLKQIADMTPGGIHEFPDNAKAVAKSLTTFLKTLREYDIIYQQPGADRASKHKTVVRVISPSRQLNLSSEPVNIGIKNMPLPLPERLGILVITVLLSLSVIFPFIKWSQKLKAEAEQGWR